MSGENIGDVKLNAEEFKKALNKLPNKYRTSAKKVMFEQHRFYTEDLMKGTPPMKLSIGRQAVSKDLDKIFIPIDKQIVLDWYSDNFGMVPKSAGKKVRSAVRGRLAGDGVIFNWNGDKARMRGFHEAMRTGRNKGVQFKSKDVSVGKGLKFGTGMYASSGKINSYKRERQKSVGKLKAGWVPAARHYGSKIPAWISKQSVKMGSWNDKIDDKRVNYMLTSTNSTPWAPRKLRALMMFATGKRQKDLDKHLKQAITRAAKKWSQSKNG